MKMIYKRVKMMMPHCSQCGEQLLGDGSFILPYQCQCGTWEMRRFPWDGEYEIIPTIKKGEK